MNETFQPISPLTRRRRRRSNTGNMTPPDIPQPPPEDLPEDSPFNGALQETERYSEELFQRELDLEHLVNLRIATPAYVHKNPRATIKTTDDTMGKVTFQQDFQTDREFHGIIIPIEDPKENIPNQYLLIGLDNSAAVIETKPDWKNITYESLRPDKNEEYDIPERWDNPSVNFVNTILSLKSYEFVPDPIFTADKTEDEDKLLQIVNNVIETATKRQEKIRRAQENTSSKIFEALRKFRTASSSTDEPPPESPNPPQPPPSTS